MKKIKSLFDYEGALLYCITNIGTLARFWFFLKDKSMGLEGIIIVFILFPIILWLSIELCLIILFINEQKSRLSWFRSLIPIIIGIGLLIFVINL